MVFPKCAHVGVWAPIRYDALRGEFLEDLMVQHIFFPDREVCTALQSPEATAINNFDYTII
jgi:hypothetical protein